jgi:hypothetical protein
MSGIGGETAEWRVFPATTSTGSVIASRPASGQDTLSTIPRRGDDVRKPSASRSAES